jgi:hypothetical protein
VGQRGPVPKDPAKRQRRNKPPEVEVLPAAHEGQVPPLPRRSKYLSTTRAWYDLWARSPQAAGFGETDWGALHALAPIVDAYWRELRKGEPSTSTLTRLHAEKVRTEAKLGATVQDRQRLRWRLPTGTQEQPAPEEPDEPTPAPTQRRRSRGGRDPRLRAVN